MQHRKFTFQKLAAPEPIVAAELENAERILARLVAVAYAKDRPDLFSKESKKQSGTPTPTSSALTLMVRGPSESRMGTTI
jgi:hypothetical protein